MVANKRTNPSHSIMQVNTSLSSDSHQFHSEHVSLPPSYIVNTPAQTNTQHASTHSESTFSSPQPRILTIPHIDTILRQSQEYVDHVLTRQWSRQIVNLPLTILPQV
jgi:hypothetical protein